MGNKQNSKYCEKLTKGGKKIKTIPGKSVHMFFLNYDMVNLILIFTKINNWNTLKKLLSSNDR